MGFYLRKAFRMGPLRLNLSKSGLGVSAGVPGARVGLTSQGRAYVHAGRGGLYVREFASSSRRSRWQSGAPSDPIVLYEETGVTFAPSGVEPSSSRLREQLVRKPRRVGIYLLLPLAGLLVLASASWVSGPQGLIATILGGALLLLWPVPMVTAWRRNRSGAQLGKELESIFASGRPLDQAQQTAVSEAIADEPVTPADRIYQTQAAYLRLVMALVEDRSVTDEELELLAQAETLLNLRGPFIGEARADAFREVYLEAIADGELSEAEQSALDHIRDRLGIPEQALQAELDVVRRLREVRQIREGDLPVIEPSKPLQKSEVCHYEAPARILKEKNLKSFQSEGQKYKVRGLVIDKDATLLITNKRLLLVHRGTTTVRLDKILDLEVDYDRSLLNVTKDGARSPVIVTTPDALKAGAIVATAAAL